MLPGQLDLLDYAKRQRDAGMSLATAAQDSIDPEWSDLAYAAIVNVARCQSEVHVDDVLRTFNRKPDHPNSWGAVWMKAIRNRIIKHSGSVRPCTVDPAKHAHQYPLYRSLICEVS